MTTLDGRVPVTEVVKICPRHPSRIWSLPSLTPPKSPYAFDLVVEVGRRRFLDHQQFQEIHDQLAQRGLSIPARSLQHLADRFALYTVAVHLESLPTLIRKRLREQGGYVLLLDGTGRAGRMTLQLTDGWSGLVLLSTHIVQESEPEVTPHLRRLHAALGRPVAAVRDAGGGLSAAVSQVWLGLYQVLCHFHFLRAEGLKLFEPLYPRLRTEIDRSGVKGRLRALRTQLRKIAHPTPEQRKALGWTEEILGTLKSGKGRVYPFHLPAWKLYRRCGKVLSRLERLGRRSGRPGALGRLKGILLRLFLPSKYRSLPEGLSQGLGERWRWFERIRKGLRYRNGPIPLSTRGVLHDVALHRGRRRLKWLVDKLTKAGAGSSRSPTVRNLKTVLRTLARDLWVHRGELFAPNVKLKVGKRTVHHLLPRTTAMAEQEFRKLRRHGRRIRGMAQVEGQVQREGPAMMLIENLHDPRYVREVYGSMAGMAERFAQVKSTTVVEAKRITGLLQ